VLTITPWNRGDPSRIKWNLRLYLFLYLHIPEHLRMIGQENA